ncbi:hypothetical protein [Actinoplanes sp. HUAS TT8]|uniref:hypothetical protein n=1 Tax=Actinoplanes sp. HUAS TT8 TaxID=3447453 RepID=UPI003F51E207
MSILLDAGPSLNFLAVGQQNILIQVAESQKLRLAAPARVDGEITGMSKDPRFRNTAVLSTWNRLKSSQRVEILPDELTTSRFIDAVARISGMPAQDRVRSGKSLGEIMVLAHASVFVQQGENVFVLIDDGDGRRRASREARWLRDNGHHHRLDLWSTRRLVQEAGRHEGWIVNGLTWQQVYDEMIAYDDGLLPRSQWKPRS